MNAIRLLTRPAKDGELLLTGLPITRSQLLEVIILAPETAREEDPVLSLLQHDPSYAFLRETAEDLYTVADVKEVA